MKVLILLACVFATGNAALVGGYNSHNVNDPEVTEMANFAVSEMAAKENAALTRGRILKVDTQVVSGINYRITMLINNGNQERKCTVVVYDQSWTKTRELTDSQCAPTKRSNLITGAPVTGDPDDPQVHKLSIMAVDKINQMSNDMFRLSASNIEHVTKQVVAGMKYTFDVTVGESTCRNSQDKMGTELAACPLNANSPMKPEIWHVEGIWQSWMTPEFRILSVTKI